MTLAVEGPLINMLVDPQRLSEYSSYELLTEASKGRLGIDQRWLHALVDHPDKSLPGIVQFATEDRSQDRIPLDSDLVSIFQFLRAPEGLPFLMEVIRADPSEVPDEVAEAVVAIGAPAVEPLLALHQEVGAENGEVVAFLLAGLGVKDPRILDLLIQRLDVDWEEGLIQLEIYHDPAAVPALEKLLETGDEEKRLDLRDTLEDLREPHEPSAVSEFNIWEFYGDEAGPEFEVLEEEDILEFLASPVTLHREQGARSLFGEEYSVAIRAKLLQLAKQDPEPEVRACAWEAFFDQTEDLELRKLMLDRLADPETPAVERAGLVLGLARHTDQDAVRAQIIELAEDPATRERAVEAMWRSFDPSFAAEVTRFLDDPEIEVRRHAIWGVGYLQVTDQAGRLTSFFNDEQLRKDALHNYALIAPGPTTRKKVTQLYDQIGELAGGLTEEEAPVVETGLDVRLVREGLKPFYQREEADGEPAAPAVAAKVGRNDPCPCGSGKKYKKCCGK